ncbi:hypothetical protein PtA15_6A85 [Puccinia triticina]|uniref:Uncharacterized protein n=1 Tax=Puccinia triticina TaxID=208348 RepID=A0ABY7CNA2_9BASI|nr:uncharacterized protein PtA15_6A85 [Puccinia triticina]WAQ85457.1 hypothetical protein PtA15_6A85 [Puccinia triticina]
MQGEGTIHPPSEAADFYRPYCWAKRGPWSTPRGLYYASGVMRRTGGIPKTHRELTEGSVKTNALLH